MMVRVLYQGAVEHPAAFLCGVILGLLILLVCILSMRTCENEDADA